MIEQFTRWIKLKLKAHQRKQRPWFSERDIWRANLGQNIGDEENGKGSQFMRPVIVLKKFNQNICLIAPTSTQLKDNKHYFGIEYNDTRYPTLISQIRTIDAKRLRKRIARLSKFELHEIKKAVATIVLDQKFDLPKEGGD